jgi:ribosome-binding factor A
MAYAVKQFDRAQRVADAIQRIVAEALQGEIKDFDFSRVTVTRCEITRDLSETTVLYSVLGTDNDRRTCAGNLSKVAGVIQRLIGDGLTLRNTPHLRFKYDESVIEAARLDELFNLIERERTDDE